MRALMRRRGWDSRDRGMREHVRGIETAAIAA